MSQYTIWKLSPLRICWIPCSIEVVKAECMPTLMADKNKSREIHQRIDECHSGSDKKHIVKFTVHTGKKVSWLLHCSLFCSYKVDPADWQLEIHLNSFPRPMAIHVKWFTDALKWSLLRSRPKMFSCWLLWNTDALASLWIWCCFLLHCKGNNPLNHVIVLSS